MKCRDARKTTYISEFPEVVTSGLLDARRHTKECRECGEFFEAEKFFGAMLRNSVKKDSVSEELKNRLLNVRMQKTRHLKRLYQALTVAASIIIVVMAGYMYSTYVKNPSILNKIVGDHIQFLPSPGMQISSSNPAEIMAWFRGRVDFSVNIPDLSADLKGGRLCRIDKKRLALLFYELNNSQISLFITDELDANKIKTGKEVMLKGRRMRLVEEKGYSLLLWQERNLTYALVSELNIEEIKKLI